MQTFTHPSGVFLGRPIGFLVVFVFVISVGEAFRLPFSVDPRADLDFYESILARASCGTQLGVERVNLRVDLFCLIFLTGEAHASCII